MGPTLGTSGASPAIYMTWELAHITISQMGEIYERPGVIISTLSGCSVPVLRGWAALSCFENATHASCKIWNMNTRSQGSFRRSGIPSGVSLQMARDKHVSRSAWLCQGTTSLGAINLRI